MLRLIFVCLFGIVFTYFVSFLQRQYKIRKLINKLPGPDGNIILGLALEIFNFKREKIIESYDEMHNTYGLLLRKWILQQPIVTIANAEDAEVILTCRTNIEKSVLYKFVHKWLGTGLLTSAGSKWTTRRKLLTPAFHFSTLNTFFDTITENCNLLLKDLEREENQQKFDVHPLISNCALDIICETAMGVKINAQERRSPYVDAIEELSRELASFRKNNSHKLRMAVVITRRMMTPWYWIDWIYLFSTLWRREEKVLKTLHGFTSQVIHQRKVEREKLGSSSGEETQEKGRKRKNKAFLDLLLDIAEESGESFSNSDIREEVDTFMFEGHDIVTVATSWAIHLIGSHPDVQEKISEELDSIFGSSDRPPTIDDIRQLKYLEMVIKETLRLFPPGFMVSRTLISDITLREFKIPSGSIVELNIHRIHRDPKHYANPKTFDPEHFTQENCIKRHPFAFIPFSAGPRNCIGQRFAMMVVKLFLSTLLRRYKFYALQRTEDLIKLAELVLRPGNGIMVRISRRKCGDRIKIHS